MPPIAQEKLKDDPAMKDLLRLAIIGSVDDGKSSLLGRLLYDSDSIPQDQLASLRTATKQRSGTKQDVMELDLSLVTDGLKAEREQGITIDVAYRYFASAKRKYIIADCPGHEEYTRNAATGSSTAEAAIILIDARAGVLTQSRRHGFIASLLGIRHFVLAVNKMDLVTYSEAVFNSIAHEYRSFAASLGIRGFHAVPVSAMEGGNVVNRDDRMSWYKGPTLLEVLDALPVEGPRDEGMRFPVQLVLRPQQDLRLYLGTVVSGQIRPGDPVIALPSRRTSRVKRLSTFAGDPAMAGPEDVVGVELTDDIDLSRGDMLVHPNNLPMVRHRLDAMLIWMSPDAARPGMACRIKHTTRTVGARLTTVHHCIDVNTMARNSASALGLNDIAHVTFEMYQPVFVDAYKENRGTGAFIVMDPQSNNTVGAGMVLHHGDMAATDRHDATDEKTHSGPATRDDREMLTGQSGAVVWLTGLPAAGKTTLGVALEWRLLREGHLAYLLDSEWFRRTLSADLDFTPEGRGENVRRASEVASFFADAGVIAIAAFVSPFRTERQKARRVMTPGRFFEVFLECPVEICAKRDTTGFYAKARTGEIRDYTGVGSPYEVPDNADLVLPTGQLTVDESVERLVEFLRGQGVLRRTGRHGMGAGRL